jgi:hypothetical protein
VDALDAKLLVQPPMQMFNAYKAELAKIDPGLVA